MGLFHGDPVLLEWMDILIKGTLICRKVLKINGRRCGDLRSGLIFPFFYPCVLSLFRFLPPWERLPSCSLSLLNLTNALTITNNNPARSKRPKRAYRPPAENSAIINERKIYAPIREAMIWNIHLIFLTRSALKIRYLLNFSKFCAQNRQEQ